MRPIHLVQLDKYRPALILTRESSREWIGKIAVAPITSRVWGLSSEVPVGPRNGLDAHSVVALDNIRTVRRALIGRRVGFLLDDQEPALAAAIAYAFDLDIPDVI
jgi:mRNA interferase MazF